jgi:exoribonuclease R
MARRKQEGIDPEEILRLLAKQPHSARQLVKDMALSRNRRMEISKVLKQLQAERKVVSLRGGSYGLPRPQNLIIGKLVQPQPGFAFLIPEKAGEPDLFIPASDLKDALPDDKVAVRVVEAGGRGCGCARTGPPPDCGQFPERTQFWFAQAGRHAVCPGIFHTRGGLGAG